MSDRPILPKITGANLRARKELARVAAGNLPPPPAEPAITEAEYLEYLAETERGFAALGFKKLRGAAK
jgi:hypothetical protein